MKLQVIVLPGGLPALVDPVSADCAENVGCYFSYSAETTHTPQLTRVDVSYMHAYYLSIAFYCFLLRVL